MIRFTFALTGLLLQKRVWSHDQDQSRISKLGQHFLSGWCFSPSSMSVISLFILHFVSFDEGFQASFPASPRKDLLAALFQKIAGPFTEMNNRFLSAETFILFLPCRTDPSRFHHWQPWADSHLSPFWDFQEFSLFPCFVQQFHSHLPAQDVLTGSKTWIHH